MSIIPVCSFSHLQENSKYYLWCENRVFDQFIYCKVINISIKDKCQEGELKILRTNFTREVVGNFLKFYHISGKRSILIPNIPLLSLFRYRKL